jgi:hypothetical protein
MNHFRKYIIIFGLIILVFAQCRKIEVYPDEPQISFIEVLAKDSVDVLDNKIKHVTLKFKVIDGDGDIGLDEADTLGPFSRDSAYYYNLFITEYEKVGDEFIEVTDIEFPRNYRIPNLTPEGQNKTLIANVSVEIEYGYSDLNPLRFTEFKYHYKVVDRSFNFSNTDTSSLIVFD